MSEFLTRYPPASLIGEVIETGPPRIERPKAIFAKSFFSLGQIVTHFCGRETRGIPFSGGVWVLPEGFRLKEERQIVVGSAR